MSGLEDKTATRKRGRVEAFNSPSSNTDASAGSDNLAEGIEGCHVRRRHKDLDVERR